jgi:hypothetical protein
MLGSAGSRTGTLLGAPGRGVACLRCTRSPCDRPSHKACSAGRLRGSPPRRHREPPAPHRVRWLPPRTVRKLRWLPPLSRMLSSVIFREPHWLASWESMDSRYCAELRAENGIVKGCRCAIRHGYRRQPAPFPSCTAKRNQPQLGVVGRDDVRRAWPTATAGAGAGRVCSERGGHGYPSNRPANAWRALLKNVQ